VTAAVVEHPSFRHALAELRQLVHEAHALGVTFRISGAEVLIKFPKPFPGRLRARLHDYRESGWLFGFLGGDRRDAEALEFADKLGIRRVLVTTRDGVREAIGHLRVDLRLYEGHLGLDIETSPLPGQGDPPPPIEFNNDGTVAEHQPPWKNDAGLDPHRAVIATLQLYAGGLCAYVFRGEALQRVLRLHWLRRQRLVVHNAGFEAKFLRHHAARKPPRHPRPGGRLDCTMQAMGLLRGVGYGGSGRGLDKAALTFLELEVPKQLQLSDWSAAELSPGQIAYAASDAILAWRLWPKMAAELADKNRREAYELQRRAIPAVADMELRGLGFDREAHAEQIEQWSLGLARARHSYTKLTGEPPPSSQVDKQAWLSRVLAEHPAHFPSWPITDSGLLSTRAGHLKRLVHIEEVRAMLAIRANEQLLNNFGPRLAERISPVTGRLHGRYNIAATKAGRFSASSPNLQQLPRKRAPEFQGCVVAAPGHRLVGCDWSQVEMRAAAWLYDDPVLTQIFAEGRDIHVETAARIAGIPVADVTDAQREAAKPLNYGSIYGQGPDGLRESAFVTYGVELSRAEAEQARRRFADTYRRLWQGLWNNYHRCKARGYVEIGCGRVVEAAWETDVDGRLLFTRCCNLPIQGICADAMLRALILAHARFKQARIRGGLVACVHDELLLEVHEDDAEKARQLLEQTMIDALTETFPGAPMNCVATAKIGQTWAEAKG
jgi:DNA polymerase I-like protein with 3'-5' exonuclease and polymerase domains